MKWIRTILKKYKYTAIVAAVGLAMMTYSLWPSTEVEPQEVSLSVIEGKLNGDKVAEAVITDEQHHIVVTLTTGEKLTATFVSESSDDLQNRLSKEHVPFTVVTDERSWLERNSDVVFTILLYAVLALLVISFLFKNQVVGSKNDFSAEQPKERFSDVKGANEAIAELQLIADYLKDPNKYKHLDLSRGFLLHGPTGTGKTLLAKALAGEAGAPFYYLAGSSLLSKWVGGTSKNIGSFFRSLKKDLSKGTGSAVVFIDEIDGLASGRKGDQGSDRDSNSAVALLLHEIEILFQTFPNVVVIGATNRLDSLDEAVKRPGRLGKHIAMPNPDEAARKEILEENGAKLKLADGVEFGSVAQMTAGLSGASVAEVCREAAMIACLRGGPEAPITLHDFERATMQVAYGTLRESADVSEVERKLSAVHESGHSVVAQASPDHNPLITTIIPIGKSGGSTWATSTAGSYDTYETLLWRLAVMMGGRVAEAIDNQRHSSGCGHDLEAATLIARSAVCNWGVFDDFVVDVDPEYWEDHPRADKIDTLVQKLLDEAIEKARTVLEENSTFRQQLQQKLLEKRILHSDQLAELAKSSAQKTDR